MNAFFDHLDRDQYTLAMADTWYDIARDARTTANRSVSDNFRSSVSRAYYAVYSKVTYTLAATPGVMFPTGREGPSHPGELGTGGIRRLIERAMPNMTQNQRVKLSELVGRLYTMRIDADYKPSVLITARDARAAVSLMNKVFNSF